MQINVIILPTHGHKYILFFWFFWSEILFYHKQYTTQPNKTEQTYSPTLEIYHRCINTLSFLMRHRLALKFIVDQIWIFIKGLHFRGSLACLLPVSFQTYFHVFRMLRMWTSFEIVLIMRELRGRGGGHRRTWLVNWYAKKQKNSSPRRDDVFSFLRVKFQQNSFSFPR